MRGAIEHQRRAQRCDRLSFQPIDGDGESARRPHRNIGSGASVSSRPVRASALVQASGPAPEFAGEWLQDARRRRDYAELTAAVERRQASRLKGGLILGLVFVGLKMADCGEKLGPGNDVDGAADLIGDGMEAGFYNNVRVARHTTPDPEF